MYCRVCNGPRSARYGWFWVKGRKVWREFGQLCWDCKRQLTAWPYLSWDEYNRVVGRPIDAGGWGI